MRSRRREDADCTHMPLRLQVAFLNPISGLGLMFGPALWLVAGGGECRDAERMYGHVRIEVEEGNIAADEPFDRLGRHRLGPEAILALVGPNPTLDTGGEFPLEVDRGGIGIWVGWGRRQRGETLASDDSDEFATNINVGFGPASTRPQWCRR
jgi:hypothetical protein